MTNHSNTDNNNQRLTSTNATNTQIQSSEVFSDPFDDLPIPPDGANKDNFFRYKFKSDLPYGMNIREMVLCCIMYHTFDEKITLESFDYTKYYRKIVSSTLFTSFSFHRWFLSKKQFIEVMKGLYKGFKSGKYVLTLINEFAASYNVSCNVQIQQEDNIEFVQTTVIDGMNVSIANYIIHERQSYFPFLMDQLTRNN